MIGKLIAMPEPLLDVGEVAELYGVSKRWVYNAAQSGDLPAFRVGRYLRFRASELEAWLQQQRNDGGSGGDYD